MQEGAQSFDMFANQSVDLANPSLPLSPLTHMQDQLLPSGQSSNQTNTQQTSVYLQPAQEETDDATDVQYDQYSTSFLKIPVEDLNDVSDTEFFDPEEENETFDKENSNVDYHTGEDEMYEDFTTNIKDTEQKLEESPVKSLNISKAEPLNPFDEDDDDTAADLSMDEPTESESSNLTTVVEAAWIGPESVTTEEAPLVLDAAPIDLSAAAAVIDIEIPAVKVKSVKKTRAPPPPEDESPLARSARLRADDFISRMSADEENDEEGGKVLYQSRGFSSTDPSLSLSKSPESFQPPLSPEARLKFGLSKLTEGPIKETPVPFKSPGTRLFTSTHGITKLRTFYPDDDATPEDAGGSVPAAAKCPHCTIHSWLPHSPSCPKLKRK